MSKKELVDIVVKPIGELATATSSKGPLRGGGMAQIKRIKNAAMAVRAGRIVAVGSEAEVMDAVETDGKTRFVDATGKMVIPGLVDPHTHLIFAGNRANEFIMRCQGKTYAEIAKAGGGIVASMSATRHATVEQLVALGLKRLQRMVSCGTTTCEIKTGYGLDNDSELRMLQAIKELTKLQPVELVPTFMPAHAFPPGADRTSYIEQIISQMYPSAAKLWKNGDQNGATAPIYNDVFCDEGYFTLEETKKILEAGLKFGMHPKVHSDEFKNLGATKLATEMKAASADHLLNVSDEEIDLLAKSDTVAVLLPGTSFFLNLSEHAPARKMIERGVAVALGSDFNPGSCHIFSLMFIWGLACLHLKMTPEEALTALTVNSAHAIGLGDSVGQLTAGYQADFLIVDVRCLEEIPYNMGWNPVVQTFKRGESVFSN